MPQQVQVFDSDLDLPQQGNMEFLEKCRALRKRINTMVAKPQIFFHNAEMYARSILRESCELQSCYEIEASQLVNEFVKAVRLQIHIIFLLSMLAHSYTGYRTPIETIKAQIENIWKAAAILNDNDLISICHTHSDSPSEEIYEAFKSSLKSVNFPSNPLVIVNKKHAEVTFPSGEKIVNDCDMLSVQGNGSSGLYCILELPDGSVESAKAYYNSNHLNSHIRIHRPSAPIIAQLCFAVLLNLSDFANGPGLNRETLKFTPYIPVSSYTSLLLKPSI